MSQIKIGFVNPLSSPIYVRYDKSLYLDFLFFNHMIVTRNSEHEIVEGERFHLLQWISFDMILVTQVDGVQN